MLRVTRPFCGHGYNMPAPGTLIDPPKDVAAYLCSIDVAEPYETKIQALPEEVKKGGALGSSHPALARPKRMRKNSRRSARKS